MTNTTTITVTITKAAAGVAESPAYPVMWNNFDTILTAVTAILTAVVLIITLVAIFGAIHIRRSAQNIAKKAARETADKAVRAVLKKYNLEGTMTQPQDAKSDTDNKEDENA